MDDPINHKHFVGDPYPVMFSNNTKSHPEEEASFARSRSDLVFYFFALFFVSTVVVLTCFRIKFVVDDARRPLHRRECRMQDLPPTYRECQDRPRLQSPL